MKNKKTLIVVLTCVLVTLIGVVLGIAFSGGFSRIFTVNPSNKVTSAQEDTRPKRSKTKTPYSISAAVFDEVDENTVSQVSTLTDSIFNTCIFNLTADNSQNTAVALSTATKCGIYAGVIADVSSGNLVLADFFEKNNPDFVILSGCNEENKGFYDALSVISTDLTNTDCAVSIGIEPANGKIITADILKLFEKEFVNFSFIRETDANRANLISIRELWDESGAYVWMCHNLTGLNDFSSEDAVRVMNEIDLTENMNMIRALCFYPYSEISCATSAPAKSVLDYIGSLQSSVLDKPFEITNYSEKDILINSSEITFIGTASPAYPVVCNGTKLERAENGDFSFDYELNVGENKIVFKYKDEEYVYNVDFEVKLLKSVSPTGDMTVPGGMNVEVTAVGVKGATLSLEYNGKTYQMDETGELYDENFDSRNGDFTTFTATVSTPRGQDTLQKLGSYRVIAEFEDESEILEGAQINVSANQKVEAPTDDDNVIFEQTETTAEVVTKKAGLTKKYRETTVKKTKVDKWHTLPTTEPITDENGNIIELTQQQTQTQSKAETTAKKAEINSMEQYSHMTNYGLGTAKICTFIDDYVEIYPGNTTSTFSTPECSPQLKGTVDYVTGVAEYDGDTYYVLSSGYKVPLTRDEKNKPGITEKVTNVKITNGYVMPKNNIKVVSCETDGNKTQIKLAMNRKVTVNAYLTGQSYQLYKAGRNVAVNSVNCTGIDFVFYDTDNADGKLYFSNSVIKSGSFASKSSDNAVCMSLKFQYAGKFYGWHTEYDENGLFVVTLKKQPTSMKDCVIMLDPGHGGGDGGADCVVTSASMGSEKDINLSIALKVKALLEELGATVYMTRTTDTFVSLQQRNEMCRQRQPDLFISIHCDSSYSSSPYGTSSYYYRAFSQPLSKSIHSALVSAYKKDIYTLKTENYKNGVSRGTSFYAYRVERVEECPSVLIEYGFVSNVSECQMLQNAGTREILAKATVNGIKQYILSED